VAIVPIALQAQLISNTLVEARIRKRIRERDSDVVRSRLTDQVDSLTDIGPCFSWISELEEECRANAIGIQVLTGAYDVVDLQAFLHSVEYALRARLHAHPSLFATGLSKCLRCFRSDEVGACLDLEWQLRVAAGDLTGEVDDPVPIQSEDIVGEPDVFSTVEVTQGTHLFGDHGCVIQTEVIAEDWLRAPVAAEWASSTGDGVQGEPTVCVGPCFAIEIMIHEIARGWWQRLRVSERTPGGRLFHSMSAGIYPGNTLDAGRISTLE